MNFDTVYRWAWDTHLRKMIQQTMYGASLRLAPVSCFLRVRHPQFFSVRGRYCHGAGAVTSSPTSPSTVALPLVHVQQGVPIHPGRACIFQLVLLGKGLSTSSWRFRAASWYLPFPAGADPLLHAFQHICPGGECCQNICAGAGSWACTAPLSASTSNSLVRLAKGQVHRKARVLAQGAGSGWSMALQVANMALPAAFLLVYTVPSTSRKAVTGVGVLSVDIGKDNPRYTVHTRPLGWATPRSSDFHKRTAGYGWLSGAGAWLHINVQVHLLLDMGISGGQCLISGSRQGGFIYILAGRTGDLPS